MIDLGSLQSESIASIAAALAKAQAQIRGALKDSDNPFFKSKYADLESVWEACRGPLTANGLSVVQTTVPFSENGTCLVTTLAHTSGEWFRGFLPLNQVKVDPQGTGSAISYCRRYSLAAIVGVVQVDDDAEAAHGRAQPPRAAGAPPKPAGQPAPPRIISEAQRTRLFAMVGKSTWGEDDVKLFMRENFGIASTKELNVRDYDVLCKAVSAGPPPGPREPGADG